MDEFGDRVRAAGTIMTHPHIYIFRFYIYIYIIIYISVYTYIYINIYIYTLILSRAKEDDATSVSSAPRVVQQKKPSMRVA